MDSAAVRSEVLARLRALSRHEISARSDAPISILKAHPILRKNWKGRNVAVYRSLPAEIQLATLEEELRLRGAILCYPRITDSAKSMMAFVRVDDPGHPESWEPGPYGGMEPRASFPEVAPESLDLVVVPGVAFGRSGERIGRGKGYYDRFLPRASRALRLALGFDFQLFPALQQSDRDRPVHCVISETEQVQTEYCRKWLESESA